MSSSERCALCNGSGPLRMSHIIPEFAYKRMYDEKHRANLLHVDTGETSIIQKGLREPLLCQLCENRFAKHEKYFAEMWNKPGAVPEVIPPSLHIVRIKDVEYKPFKLFHLSLLWRIGVSKSAQYARINLGPHERIIRELLLNDDPGRPSRYPVVGMIIYIESNRRVASGTIPPPVISRVDGHHSYMLMFAGCSWTYMVSNHRSDLHDYGNVEKSGDLELATGCAAEYTNVLKHMKHHRDIAIKKGIWKGLRLK